MKDFGVITYLIATFKLLNNFFIALVRIKHFFFGGVKEDLKHNITKLEHIELSKDTYRKLLVLIRAITDRHPIF